MVSDCRRPLPDRSVELRGSYAATPITNWRYMLDANTRDLLFAHEPNRLTCLRSFSNAKLSLKFRAGDGVRLQPLQFFLLNADDSWLLARLQQFFL